MCWIPSFFSREMRGDLGRFAILDHVLAGGRFATYADHLSDTDQHAARQVLDSQHGALRQQLRRAILQAYGIERATPDAIDVALGHEGGELASLKQGFAPQRPVAATLAEALEGLLDQCLSHEYPRHPELTVVARPAELRKVLEVVRQAVADEHGRVPIIEPAKRPALRGIAQPLGLGVLHEGPFVLSDSWPNRLGPKLAAVQGPVTVGTMRAWLDEPEPLGLTRELASLLVIAVAEQLGRRFVDHHATVVATIDGLRDDWQLEEQPLPQRTVWDQALARIPELGLFRADR